MVLAQVLATTGYTTSGVHLAFGNCLMIPESQCHLKYTSVHTHVYRNNTHIKKRNPDSIKVIEKSNFNCAGDRISACEAFNWKL